LTYLLSQIFISLLLAGLAGGAFGWILHGFKAHQRERELKSTLERHNAVLAQAQQERQMIADDYDEMKLGFESRIGELQFENRKLPDLEENLEKSQQLVIQMIKKHEAETGELAAMNNELHDQLEGLKAGHKNAAAEATATATGETLRKVKAERGDDDASITSSVSGPGQPPMQNADSSHQQGLRNTDKPEYSKRSASDESGTSGKVALGAAPAVASAQQRSIDNHQRLKDPKPDLNLNDSTPGNAARASVRPAAAVVAPEALNLMQDKVADGVSETHQQAHLQAHLQGKAAEQKELLALESEIEEMRSMDGQGHLAGSGNSDGNMEHERELDLDGLGDSNAIDLARDIDQEIATPVTVEDMQLASESDVKTASLPTTDNDAIHNIGDGEDNSDVLRTSLRKKFSDKSDDDVDDLQIIHGIGPVIERSLNDIGITSFNQLATLTRHEIEEVAEILKIFPGRIERDNWIGNARRLVSTEQKDSLSSDTGSSHSRPGKEELENA